MSKIYRNERDIGQSVQRPSTATRKSIQDEKCSLLQWPLFK